MFDFVRDKDFGFEYILKEYSKLDEDAWNIYFYEKEVYYELISSFNNKFKLTVGSILDEDLFFKKGFLKLIWRYFTENSDKMCGTFFSLQLLIIFQFKLLDKDFGFI